MGQVVAVIPARLASTRLPRKVLLSETGMPLIQHVWQGASRASGIDRVIVATDDQEVMDACNAFGAEAMMTSPECACGTDRVAEVASRLPEANLVINVQGDEPEMDHRVLEALVAVMQANPSAEMGTVATPWPERLPLDIPGFVKVVTDLSGRALYFSRNPIPHIRDQAAGKAALTNAGHAGKGEHALYLRHIGLYAYQRDFLLKFATWSPTTLELAESLEQLRALEHGARIVVARVDYDGREVNTPEDYAEFVRRWKSR